MRTVIYVVVSAIVGWLALSFVAGYTTGRAGMVLGPPAAGLIGLSGIVAGAVVGFLLARRGRRATRTDSAGDGQHG